MTETPASSPQRPGSPSAEGHTPRPSLGTLLPAFGLLVVGLVGTALGTRQVYTSWRAEVERTFAFHNAEAALALEGRLDVYATAVRSVRGLYAASKSVERGELRAFDSAMDRERTYRALLAVGFVQRLPAASREASLELIRQDEAPHFAIYPPMERDEHWPVRFLEPRAGFERLWGFDLRSDAALEAVLGQTQREGEIGLSGPVVLPGASERQLLMVGPIYENGRPHATPEERKQNATGWALAVISPELLAVHAQSALDDGVQLTLYDAPEARADSAPPDDAARVVGSPAPRGDLTQDIVLSRYGRRWTLRFTAGAAVVDRLRRSELWLAPAAGLAISLLLFAIGYSLARTRARASALAAAMTVDLEDARRQLSRALDAALESTRAKAQFLANMSHEIRTPMNAVIGMTGLLERTPLNERQQTFVVTIRQSGEALLQVINDILDFSKMEAGKLHFEDQDFSLTTTVSEAVALVAPLATRKAIELQTAIYGGVPTALRGDASRLRQVLVNLVGNAVKFTDRGEVTLRVRLQERGDDSVLLHFGVSDTGIGITEDVAARLFKPFTQADGSTTRRYGGTGLGLAISREIVTQMGGEIGAEPNPGGGAHFWFTVRFQVTSGAVVDSGPSSLRAMRVLVVDDIRTNREMMIEQLKAWEMDVEAVESGVLAYDRLRSAASGGRPFQIVLIDMQMPGMDGAALAHLIRADKALAGAQLVLLSSLADLVANSKALFDRRLNKPVQPSELLNVLVNLGAGRLLDVAPSAIQPAQTVVSGRARILVAEDNTANQMVARMQLELLGVRPDVVGTGVEALAALRVAPYDLILMDCQMPEMDGFAATAAIRATEGERRRTAIVALTANAMEGDRDRCLSAGMDDYIPKPVRIEDLTRALQKWLSPELLVPAAADEAEPSEPGAADDDDEPSLDRAELSRLLALVTAPADRALLFERFEADFKRALSALESAGRGEEIAKAAHSLKGTALTLGATEIADLAKRLESASGDGEMETALELTRVLGPAFERFKTAWSAEVRGAD